MTSGSTKIGTPEGTNSLKKCRPFLAKPTTSTVRNTSAASAAVTTRWLVTVNPPGIMPSMLQTKMKMKSVNTKGKNFIPSLPMFSRSMPATNSWLTSATDCSRPGTSARARVAYKKKAVVNSTASSMKAAELVKETSQPNSFSGTRRCRSN